MPCNGSRQAGPWPGLIEIMQLHYLPTHLPWCLLSNQLFTQELKQCCMSFDRFLYCQSSSTDNQRTTAELGGDKQQDHVVLYLGITGILQVRSHSRAMHNSQKGCTYHVFGVTRCMAGWRHVQCTYVCSGMIPCIRISGSDLHT